MWISKTPLRLSFVGGNTDLPAFFEKEEGATLSVAVNKYIHVTLRPRFDKTFRVAYENTELVNHPGELNHPVARHIFTKYERVDAGWDVASISDVPAGTGMGSSSCFTVGLLNAIHASLGNKRTQDELAKEACEIEYNENPQAIGRQDQYAVTYGGANIFRFRTNGEVTRDPIDAKKPIMKELDKSLLLFYTGLTRPAAKLLKRQSEQAPKNFQTLKKMKDLVWEMKSVIDRDGDISEIGKILHRSWELKRTLIDGITNEKIEHWYGRALEAGASGGKLMGAGGGGFLMFVCEPSNQDKLKSALSELQCTHVEFDNEGTRLLTTSDEVGET